MSTETLLHVPVDKETAAKLKAIKEAHGITITAFVRLAIQDRLERFVPPTLMEGERDQ